MITLLNCVLLIGSLVLSFLLGVFVTNAFTKVDGLFVIQNVDEEHERWTLDMKTDPENIKNKKEVRLRVTIMKDGDV